VRSSELDTATTEASQERSTSVYRSATFTDDGMNSGFVFQPARVLAGGDAVDADDVMEQVMNQPGKCVVLFFYVFRVAFYVFRMIVSAFVADADDVMEQVMKQPGSVLCCFLCFLYHRGPVTFLSLCSIRINASHFSRHASSS
jgi:hypothetical protein